MSLKIALLGFGTVASGIPFLLEENDKKNDSSARNGHSNLKSFSA